MAAGEPVVAQTMLVPLIERAVRAYAAGFPAHPVPGELISALTPRERQVLEFMSEGRRDREIAQDLFISVATAKGHVRKVLAKLGVPSRVGAAVIAHQAGLGPERAPPGLGDRVRPAELVDGAAGQGDCRLALDMTTGTVPGARAATPARLSSSGPIVGRDRRS